MTLNEGAGSVHLLPGYRQNACATSSTDPSATHSKCDNGLQKHRSATFRRIPGWPRELHTPVARRHAGLHIPVTTRSLSSPRFGRGGVG